MLRVRSKLGPHVLPPCAPPQPGRPRRLSLPAFGLLVAIRSPCTSGQGPVWVNEVRSDAAPRDQSSEAVHVVFVFEQKTNFHHGGGPRPNINPSVRRLNGFEREYERISGSELDQTVKTGTLMEQAPPQMQEHLRSRSEEIGTNYKKVIQAIEGYLRWKTNLEHWP